MVDKFKRSFYVTVPKKLLENITMLGAIDFLDMLWNHYDLNIAFALTNKQILADSFRITNNLMLNRIIKHLKQLGIIECHTKGSYRRIQFAQDYAHLKEHSAHNTFFILPRPIFADSSLTLQMLKMAEHFFSFTNNGKTCFQLRATLKKEIGFIDDQYYAKCLSTLDKYFLRTYKQVPNSKHQTLETSEQFNLKSADKYLDLYTADFMTMCTYTQSIASSVAIMESYTQSVSSSLGSEMPSVSSSLGTSQICVSSSLGMEAESVSSTPHGTETSNYLNISSTEMYNDPLENSTNLQPVLPEKEDLKMNNDDIKLTSYVRCIFENANLRISRLNIPTLTPFGTDDMQMVLDVCNADDIKMTSKDLEYGIAWFMGVLNNKMTNPAKYLITLINNRDIYKRIAEFKLTPAAQDPTKTFMTHPSYRPFVAPPARKQKPDGIKWMVDKCLRKTIAASG